MKTKLKRARKLLQKIETLKKEIVTRRDTLRGTFSDLEDICESLTEADGLLEEGVTNVRAGLERMSEFL